MFKVGRESGVVAAVYFFGGWRRAGLARGSPPVNQRISRRDAVGVVGRRGQATRGHHLSRRAPSSRASHHLSAGLEARSPHPASPRRRIPRPFAELRNLPDCGRFTPQPGKTVAGIAFSRAPRPALKVLGSLDNKRARVRRSPWSRDAAWAKSRRTNKRPSRAGPFDRWLVSACQTGTGEGSGAARNTGRDRDTTGWRGLHARRPISRTRRLRIRHQSMTRRPSRRAPCSRPQIPQPVLRSPVCPPFPV